MTHGEFYRYLDVVQPGWREGITPLGRDVTVGGKTGKLVWVSPTDPIGSHWGPLIALTDLVKTDFATSMILTALQIDL